MAKRLTLKEVFMSEDGEVVSLGDFRAKKERKGKTFGMLVTPDGEMMAHPDDMRYVIITSEEQGDALADGNVELAKELGAQFFEIGPGKPS